jgi:DNA-binding CsgD family transcriptional regulator
MRKFKSLTEKEKKVVRMLVQENTDKTAKELAKLAKVKWQSIATLMGNYTRGWGV